MGRLVAVAFANGAGREGEARAAAEDGRTVFDPASVPLLALAQPCGGRAHALSA